MLDDVKVLTAITVKKIGSGVPANIRLHQAWNCRLPQGHQRIVIHRQFGCLGQQGFSLARIKILVALINERVRYLVATVLDVCDDKR